MRRPVLGMILGLCLTCPRVTLAQTRWVTIVRPAEGAAGSGMYADTTTIGRAREGHLLVWLKYTYNTTRKTRSGKSYRSVLMRDEIDCAGGRNGSTQMIFYGPPPLEDVVEQQAFGDNPQMVAPAPDTMGEIEVLAVCRVAGK